MFLVFLESSFNLCDLACEYNLKTFSSIMFCMLRYCDLELISCKVYTAIDGLGNGISENYKWWESPCGEVGV